MEPCYLLFCSRCSAGESGRIDRLHKEAQPMQAQDKPSLYDRLGGVYNIATVVDDIDRIMNDLRLNASPRVNEAHHRVAPAEDSSIS